MVSAKVKWSIRSGAPRELGKKTEVPCDVEYTDTTLMLADIHIKGFTDEEKWKHAQATAGIKRKNDMAGKVFWAEKRRYRRRIIAPLVYTGSSLELRALSSSPQALWLPAHVLLSDMATLSIYVYRCLLINGERILSLERLSLPIVACSWLSNIDQMGVVL